MQLDYIWGKTVDVHSVFRRLDSSLTKSFCCLNLTGYMSGCEPLTRGDRDVRAKLFVCKWQQPPDDSEAVRKW